MPINTFCPNNKDHGWVRTVCPYCRYEELERKLAAAREALQLAQKYGNFDPLSDQTIIRAIAAALTEAGEGEK